MTSPYRPARPHSAHRAGRVPAGGALLAAALLLGAALAEPAAATAGQPASGLSRSALDWGACPAPTPNANGSYYPRDPREQCATLRVPRDYRQPGAGSITLTVSRIRTADPAHRLGDLVVVPGGPGGSGLDYSSQLLGILPAAVPASYDLIGFDERGVGNSTPVACGLSAADRAAELNYPYPAPDGDISGNLAFAKRVADTCAATAGDYLGDISTADSARDLDRIRTALGVPKISYLGSSYGTYLGQIYATMFAPHTDKVVLDSTVAPGGVEQGMSLYGLGTEQAFPALAAYLAQQDATLHLSATQAAVRAGYFRLAAKLDRTPLRLGDGRVLDGNGFRALTFSVLTNAAYYPLAARAWQAADTGVLPPPGPGGGSTLPTVIPDNFVAAQDAVICNDTPWPRDPGYYAARTAADRIRYPLSNGMPGNVWPCAYWHYGPTEPPVRADPIGPRNILMLQNLKDPDTAYAGARQTLSAFGHRAAMVTLEATGHGVDFADPKVADPFTAFLLTGRLPTGNRSSCTGPPSRYSARTRRPRGAPQAGVRQQ